MTTRGIYIAIVEPSRIIFQGLVSMITDTGRNFHIFHAADLTALQHLSARNPPDLVILNPSFLQSDLKTFQTFRNEQPAVKWIGIVYSFFDQRLLALLDGTISINELQHSIIGVIQQVIKSPKAQDPDSAQESLSDRETEVLQLLVTGLANKEIADKLNISTHTVITHRKNISIKTGIKSVSGLTLYAVVKGFISVDHFAG
jgi:DNA-binding NarL/FixJ family response regulator